MGVKLPAKPFPDLVLEKPFLVFVIHNAQGEGMFNTLQQALQREGIKLSNNIDGARDQIAEADHVLLLLTEKILQQPCLDQLREVMLRDRVYGCDRLTMIYSEDKLKYGWEFNCDEHRACAERYPQVKAALDDHEAVIFKEIDARNRHEFPAMRDHLLEQIVRRSMQRHAMLAQLTDSAREGLETELEAARAASSPDDDDAVSPRATTATADDSSVLDWLTQFKLASYADGMSEQGYDDLLFLRDLSEADIDELIVDVRMKKGHAKKFKLEWKALSGRWC